MGRVAAVLRESNPFADFVRAFAPVMGQELDRRRQEEDLRKSLEVFAGVNAPLPEDTTMRPTVVQTPTAPLPGQGTVTTQPSAPVADMPPVQTQTTTVDLPQKDPYKEGLKNIELAYREKIKNVTQMKNPTLALKFLQQSMQERDIAKAEHNSAAFQSTLNEIMNNPNLTPAQRIGMAVKANSTFKAGFKVGDIFKMFEPEKPNLQIAPNGMVVDMRTGLPVQGTPTYAKPDKPDNTVQWGPIQYDPQGKAYQISNRNEVRPLPNYDKAPKDTSLQELDKEEKREMDYLEKTKPNQYATPAQIAAYQAEVAKLKAKYEGRRAELKDRKDTKQSSNELTPEEFEQAKQLKALGLTKEQIKAEIEFRRSGGKSR